MIEVKISKEMLKEARQKAEDLGRLRNSITKGDGNVVGFLGEMVAQTVIGGDIVGTRDYDILTDDGVKWEVKSKRCKDAPEPNYDCSVTNYNTQQKCDNYVFVRVKADFTVGWVLGQLPREEYYAKSTFIHQGQYDPTNHWRAKCDCWNVPISDLNEVKSV